MTAIAGLVVLFSFVFVFEQPGEDKLEWAALWGLTAKLTIALLFMPFTVSAIIIINIHTKEAPVCDEEQKTKSALTWMKWGLGIMAGLLPVFVIAHGILLGFHITS